MKRKSVSIKDENVIKFIEKCSETLKCSESSLVEKILLHYIKNNKELTTQRAKKANDILFYSWIKSAANNGSYLKLSERSLSNSFLFSISFNELVNQSNEIDKVLIYKIIRKKILEYIKKHDFYISNGNLKFYQLKENEVINIVTLSLIDVKEIKLIDNKAINQDKVKKIDRKYDNIISSLTSGSDLINVSNMYDEIEKDIINILNESFIEIHLKFEGFILPIVIDDTVNRYNLFYDFLNVKYLSHRKFKKYHEYRENFLVLMNCKYGFFACDIFNKPKNCQFFIDKFHEIKSKKSANRNISTFIIDNNIIKLSPDYPTIKNHSNLIRKLLKVRTEKKSICRNIISLKLNKTNKSLFLDFNDDEQIWKE